MPHTNRRTFQDLMRHARVTPINGPYSEWRGCSNKLAHTTEFAARREAERLNVQNERRKVEKHVDAYACDVCGAWHVGKGKES